MSPTYVVDCSLMVDALSAREGDDVLRQRLSAPRTLHAPHHLDVEVASTVRGLAAGQKVTDHRGEQMLADYSRLRITRHPVNATARASPTITPCSRLRKTTPTTVTR